VGRVRPARVLFDGADGAALLDEGRLAARREAIDPSARTAPASVTRPGGTIYLCAADSDGMGVSLIQSNAAGWGCHLVVPRTGIFLQNRGIGFSLAPGTRPNSRGGVVRRTPSPRPRPDPYGGLTAVLGTKAGTSNRRWCCSCWPGCWTPGSPLRCGRPALDAG